MSRYLIAILLGTSLVAPVAVRSDDKDRHEKRYYDRTHKDYHAWNDDEDRAYRRFLEEHHREYHDWAKARRSEQDEYWKWRHEHHD
jgi:type III secretory pathway component EscR